MTEFVICCLLLFFFEEREITIAHLKGELYKVSRQVLFLNSFILFKLTCSILYFLVIVQLQLYINHVL